MAHRASGMVRRGGCQSAAPPWQGRVAVTWWWLGGVALALALGAWAYVMRELGRCIDRPAEEAEPERTGGHST